jgi:hypothetical protein
MGPTPITQRPTHGSGLNLSNFHITFTAPTLLHINLIQKSNPASRTMGTGSFPWVKRPGRGVEPSPPSSAEVRERVELYIYSPSGPSWPVLGWPLPLPLPFRKVTINIGTFKKLPSDKTKIADINLTLSHSKWLSYGAKVT